MTFKTALITTTVLFGLLRARIDYCATYAPKADESDAETCQRCEPGFEPSPTRTFCLEAIANCHQLSDSGAHSTCAECKPGFVLSTSKRLCLKAALSNCVEISLANGRCVQCKPLFIATGEELHQMTRRLNRRAGQVGEEFEEFLVAGKQMQSHRSASPVRGKIVSRHRARSARGRQGDGLRPGNAWQGDRFHSRPADRSPR